MVKYFRRLRVTARGVSINKMFYIRLGLGIDDAQLGLP